MMANLANIKYVWGEASKQYQESISLAAGDTSPFSGTAKTAEDLQVDEGRMNSIGASEKKPTLGTGTFSLALRPKSSN